MLVFLNGRFVSKERAVISIFDRGFLYGDGLFETVRVSNSAPFRWTQHLERLCRGAEFLRIRLPFSPDALRDFAAHLIARNKMSDSILRLALSRGIGRRGYSPKGADDPTLAMTLHPLPAFSRRDPPRWKLATSSFRLPAGERLARFKTSNKLPHILARAEAEAAGADEALLLNTDGHVVEAGSGNLFWVGGKCVFTPPLAGGVLPGVTRAVVLEICKALGVPTDQRNITPARLHGAQGVFLSLSSVGVVEARSLDNRLLRRSPLTGKILQAYWKKLATECATVTTRSK